MKVLLVWSGGILAAHALDVLRQDPAVTVVGLLAVIDPATRRAPRADIHVALIEAQAAAAGLPLTTLDAAIGGPPDSEDPVWTSALSAARAEGVTAIAISGLRATGVEAARETCVRRAGLAVLAPLGGRDSSELVRTMIRSGHRSRLVRVDPTRLDRAFAGRELDHGLVLDLPDDVDPCGDDDAFHTFCYAAPVFAAPLDVRAGPVRDREGLVLADLVLAAADEGPALRAFSHALLASPDVPRLAGFIRSVFGLTPQFENEEFVEFVLAGGFRLALFRATGGVAQYFDERASRGAAAWGVTVGNVDAVHRRAVDQAAALGLEISGPPKDHPWGERSFLLVDPDGNRWEIAQSVTPDGMLPQRSFGT